MNKQILLINGLIKKGGNTDFLLRHLLDCASAAVNEVVLRSAKIQHCTDCEFCLSNGGKCCFNDDMSLIFDYSKTADYVIIASPIVFENVSGYISNAISRFQSAYGKADFSNLPQVGKPKKAIIILTGGGGGGKPVMAEKTTRLFAKMLNSKTIEFITSYNTDTIKAKDDMVAIDKLEKIIQEINAN